MVQRYYTNNHKTKFSHIYFKIFLYRIYNTRIYQYFKYNRNKNLKINSVLFFLYQKHPYLCIVLK